MPRKRRHFFLIGLASSFLLLPTFLFSQISVSERNALIFLYSSTKGDAWTQTEGWKTPPLHSDGFALPGTETGWHGVTVAADHVTELWLNSNNLDGTIPAALGNLPYLNNLILDSNKLTGSIPAELGNLSSLVWLYLNSNQLTGSIPPQLGNLSSLTRLILNTNQLSGALPSELGNLTSLEWFYIHSNQLSEELPSQLGNLTAMQHFVLFGNRLHGAVPTSFTNLTSLTSGLVDLRWNALFTDSEPLRTFLNGKQAGGDWESTQTIAPAHVTAGAVTHNSVTVSWNPIAYTGNTGGYEVCYSTSPGEPYNYFGITANKSTSSMQVTGLNAATQYYFVVSTITQPHVNNANQVYSIALSNEASTETSLPVSLSSFSARPEESGVTLEWVSESEIENAGYILEKKEGEQAVWQPLASYQSHEALIGQGNASWQNTYTFTDEAVEPGKTYCYQLSDVDMAGRINLYDVITITLPDASNETTLLPAFPNPFNPATKINYQLAASGHVEIAVFDLLGRKVKTLLSGDQPAGSYAVYWHGNDVAGHKAATGTYILRMTAGKQVKIQRVVLLR